MKLVNTILLIYISLILIFCTNNDCKKPKFFPESKKNIPKQCYIRIDSIYTNDSICGYRCWLYDGKMASFHFLKGFIYENSNKIYFVAESPSKVKFVMFDFNLKVGDYEFIDYSRKFKEFDLDTIIIKKYSLKLESKFHDSQLNDTIYKFRFEKYGVYTRTNDFVYFVGKNAGIVGCYMSDLDADSTTLIIGGLRGNVYRNLYDYSKVEYKVIE